MLLIRNIWNPDFMGNGFFAGTGFYRSRIRIRFLKSRIRLYPVKMDFKKPIPPELNPRSNDVVPQY
jgi:hypothetical protein